MLHSKSHLSGLENIRGPSISGTPADEENSGGGGDIQQSSFAVDGLAELAKALGSPETTLVTEAASQSGVKFVLHPRQKPHEVLKALRTTSYFIGYSTLLAIAASHGSDPLGDAAFQLFQVLRIVHDNRQLLNSLRSFLAAYDVHGRRKTR